MKTANTYLSFLLLCSIATQSMASGNEDHQLKLKPSAYIGYEWGTLQGYGKLKGPNIKFDMLSDSPVGIMMSFSFLKDKWDEKDKSRRGNFDEWGNRLKTQYLSTMIGPTIKINEVISAYALVGGSWVRVKGNDGGYGNNPIKPDLAYSVGLTANITDKLVLSGGYESARLNLLDEKSKFDGYMFNIGYRF